MAKKNVKLIYDTCASLVKQAEAQAEKGQDVDQSILDALTTAFTDIIEFEKIYLIPVSGQILWNCSYGYGFWYWLWAKRTCSI